MLLRWAGLFACVMIVLGHCWPAAGASAQQETTVLATRVDGTITPIVADHLTESVASAGRDGHQALLVELDTPGGLDTSMRDIVQAFLGAQVPVLVHVAPSGARAASAGALITFSAHVAAMAPGTTIGAATPVDLQGGEISDKIINDAAAFARSVAAQRGRNVEFAEATVRQGKAVTAAEAVELEAVDLVAASRSALLEAVDGREVVLAGGQKTILRTAGAPVVEHDMGTLAQLRQILADPNLAFLFMSIGILAVLYELASPGAGIGGMVGVILLLLGLVSLSVLPVEIAGIALLVLAAALFAAEVLTAGVGVFAAGGAIALVLAGLFLFDGPFEVNLAVLLPVAVIVSGGAIVAGKLALKARQARPVTGQEGLIGMRTRVDDVDGDTGRALVDGSWWRVRATSGPLSDGQRVRVTGLEGLTLLVEPDPGDRSEGNIDE